MMTENGGLAVEPRATALTSVSLIGGVGIGIALTIWILKIQSLNPTVSLTRESRLPSRLSSGRC